LFAQNGYSVAIHYNKNKKLAEDFFTLLKEQNYSVMLVKADVSVRAEVKRMFSEIINNFGEIDILVNNAGIAQQKLFTDVSEEDWDKIFDINVKSVFNCCQEAIPAMVRKKYGKIINISSIWGMTGASCEVVYSASKAALLGLTKALAKELGPSGICVNCVAPGIVATDMIASIDKDILEELKNETPLEVIGKAKDIAEAVFFLASDKAGFITGQIISPNGGFLI
jgi:3-oxoacyl-[acyl-carrier protein] reductase